MALFRNSLSRRFQPLLKSRAHLCNYHIILSNIPHFQKLLPFLHRPISSSPQIDDPVEPELERKQNKKPLHVLFKEVVGLAKKTGNSENEIECEAEDKELQRNLKQLEGEVRSLKSKPKSKVKEVEIKEISKKDKLKKGFFAEHKELKRKLRQLEGEFRSLKAKIKMEEIEKKENLKKPKKKKKKEGVEEKENMTQGKEKETVDVVDKKIAEQKKSLSALFRNEPAGDVMTKRKEAKRREPIYNAPILQKCFRTRSACISLSISLPDTRVVYKELSPAIVIFLKHLHKERYFNDANFVKGGRFNLDSFENIYARNYILFAAERFGRDNQNITKWLSGSDLKQVAMFGCPSMERRGVFPAKRLRAFFDIPEDTVCIKCMLKQSCKSVNQSLKKVDSNLDLATTLKLITLYALEEVHPQLLVPNEIKESVSRLLREVLKLSQTA